ncbi:MAG: hypothetical protein ACE5GZ_02685 [Gammaproteobacteria bacterium]
MDIIYKFDGLKRPHQEEKKRIFSALLLFLMIVIMELTVGSSLEIENNLSIRHQYNNALGSYKMSGNVALATFTNSKRTKIVYISNSHALTGGHVARHLQDFLNLLEPGHFEVLDMSEAGIFAPDMLQRALFSLAFKPKLIIFGVSYISFSDRMKLSLQSHSARSFFKTHVFGKLPVGFWTRNYDIGIYLDTLFSRFVRLYNYRNKLRDKWERPLLLILRKYFGGKHILFLEVDVDQSWRFPQGYDRNLFQWDLYSSGRSNHLADMHDAITITKKNKVDVLALNLPVHWEKSIYNFSKRDYSRFREELTDVFSGVDEYVDYESFFPKEFSTYDALHPTWYGARLHALDIVLRLKHHNYISPNIDEKKIVSIFNSMEESISSAYRSKLNGDYPSLQKIAFRRYDIFEPDNARKLLEQLAIYKAGSILEENILYDLSLRIRYWSETDFPDLYNERDMDSFFKQGVESDIKKAKERALFFKNRLIEYQTTKLRSFPVPDLQDLEPDKTVLRKIASNLVVRVALYRLESKLVIEISDQSGRRIAYQVKNTDNHTEYRRVDILGDGSFILLQQAYDRFIVPSWITYQKPYVKFGV